jgi:lipopolysaccharide/colanic/teichoic acid biosynthesis glycosyltransferase
LTILSKNPAEQFSSHATIVDISQPTWRHSLYQNYIKRLLDVLLVVGSAPFVLPMVLGLAAVIWARGGKPFYLQDRVGRNGKLYSIWKLRTMVENAEDALETYLENNPEARVEWEATQKLKYDPRITAFGRVLRKTSFDELPQLWNVLKGDMSLVGPRPMLPEQRGMYPGTRYYDMRPGITGIWQVSARNNCSFQGRASFDTVYFRDMSLWTDIKLIGATFAVVIKATGQ